MKPKRPRPAYRPHGVERLNSHINFDRESSKGNARKDPTKVVCCVCKKVCVVPFKPRNPEVYCDECFKQKNKKRY